MNKYLDISPEVAAALSLPAAASVTRRPALSVAGTVPAGAGAVAVGAAQRRAMFQKRAGNLRLLNIPAARI